ncbi:MAG: FkbM family methyltransferase [Nostoc sp.]|uniref:FkbM family methyltransferase n=1 Tax=Nostoc sp. TaxID=1180 RepID=UPI002FF112C8
MHKKVITATIPVVFDFPQEEFDTVDEVFMRGEYESGYFGENLTILDIGANIGCFAVWANMRWPKSKIHAFEPHPETFKILIQNVKSIDNIICHNVAVYPSDRQKEIFYARHPGDGEAGLTHYLNKYYKIFESDNLFEVPIFHPAKLPEADIVKIDTEGAEFQILDNMDISGVSLILLEYHHLNDKNKIKEILQKDFFLEFEEDIKYWNASLPILGYDNYQENLADDYRGRLFFTNRNSNKLKKYI